MGTIYFKLYHVIPTYWGFMYLLTIKVAMDIDFVGFRMRR